MDGFMDCTILSSLQKFPVLEVNEVDIIIQSERHKSIGGFFRQLIQKYPGIDFLYGIMVKHGVVFKSGRL